MTKVNKELLLKDLSARLPYGVKLDFYTSATNEHIVCTLLGIEPEGDKPIIAKVDCGAFMFQQDHIKPYLRSMSSMKDEELSEYRAACRYHNIKGTVVYEDTYKSLDWLNMKHFDYRGLIEIGLAIEAPKDIYK